MLGPVLPDPEVQTEMRPIFPLLRILLLLTTAIPGLLALGCGVKGPPIPPQMVPPPPVTDLQGRVVEDRAVLTWTGPGRASRRVMEMTGFRVYRARTPLSESACENCPLSFEQAAELNPGPQPESQMRFSEALQPGYRYTYKVVGYGAGDNRFEDSNLVALEFP
jgi:hypothetical protein